MFDLKLAPSAWFAVAGAAALGFGALAVAVARGKTVRLDRRVNGSLAGSGSHAIELAAVSTTPAGKWWAHLPATASTAVRLLRDDRKAGALALVGSSLGSVALTRLLDRWLARRGPQPRRGRLSNHSFPSGHALQTSAVALTTSYVLSRENFGPSWTAPLGALSLGAGISKLLLARHWTSDVLGGYLAGIAWGATCAAGYELGRKRELRVE